MPIVNYAKLYRMFRLLIGISLLCSHHLCQLAAVKKTRLQADSLSFWVLGRLFGKIYIFYKFLGGVFSGNTRKKCVGVYNGIPMVYFGGYVLYQQYVYSVVYVPAICLWCCKSLSFGCI